MNSIHSRLIEHARKVHGNITPCNGDKNFNNSFSPISEYGEVILWFNRECGSCAILKESQLPKPKN